MLKLIIGILFLSYLFLLGITILLVCVFVPILYFRSLALAAVAHRNFNLAHRAERWPYACLVLHLLEPWITTLCMFIGLFYFKAPTNRDISWIFEVIYKYPIALLGLLPSVLVLLPYLDRAWPSHLQLLQATLKQRAFKRFVLTIVCMIGGTYGFLLLLASLWLPLAVVWATQLLRQTLNDIEDAMGVPMSSPFDSSTRLGASEAVVGMGMQPIPPIFLSQIVTHTSYQYWYGDDAKQPRLDNQRPLNRDET